MTDTTVKRLLFCGFRRTGKAMRHVYQCWWRIYREIQVFFQVQISHVLRFISICDLFTDSPRNLSIYRIVLFNELQGILLVHPNPAERPV
jgi:hypothetical protein